MQTVTDNTQAPSAAGRLPALPPVPDDFRDAQGNVRVAALWQAFVTLQKQVQQAQNPLSAGDGAPESPEGYCIDCSHGLFDADPEINGRLHQAGYSPKQAQLLYDLAAERMLPLLQQMAGGMKAEQETQRLVDHFGGADKWRQISRQIQSWGERNLPPDAVSTLATTFDGVMTLFRMMQGGEPSTVKGAGGAGGALSEADLYALMRDPRYWRERRGDVVAKVTEGFRRLYPDN